MADSSAFPWLKHLPDDAAREFFEELSEAFGEAQMRTMPGVLVSPQTYVEVLDPLLAAWKATAEVHADPELYKALTQDHEGGFEDNFVPAPRPEGHEPRYKQGSIITQGKTVPGARRWEVLDVLDGGYRVRLLFSGFSNGRLEPPIALWPFELCEAHTELEWQKTEPEGVIDENGRASVPKPREGAHDHDRG